MCFTSKRQLFYRLLLFSKCVSRSCHFLGWMHCVHIVNGIFHHHFSLQSIYQSQWAKKSASFCWFFSFFQSNGRSDSISMIWSFGFISSSKDWWSITKIKLTTDKITELHYTEKWKKFQNQTPNKHIVSHCLNTSSYWNMIHFVVFFFAFRCVIVGC